MATALEYIRQGKEFAEKLQLAAAEEQFKNAVSVDSTSVEALMWLGRLQLMQNREEEGMRNVDGALFLAPRHAEALAIKGIANLRKRDFSTAIALLEQAKEIDPQLVMIYANLALCYRETKQLDLAQKAASEGIRLNPKNWMAYYEMAFIHGEKGEAKESFQACFMSVRSNPLFLKGYLTMGTMLMMSRKYDEAVLFLRSGVRNLPAVMALREQICVALAQKGDFASALEEALEIVKRRNSPGDHLRVGIYALALGKFEIAEKAFKKAVELDPAGWEGHYNLGEVYLAAKLVDEAETQYKNAMTKAPNQWKAYNAMGLLMLHHRNDAEAARNYLLRALHLSRGLPVPLLNLALACATLKDHESAEKFCRDALKMARPNSDIWNEAHRLLNAVQTEKAS